MFASPGAGAGGGSGTPLSLAVRHMGDPASRARAAAPTSLSAGAGPAVTILVLPGELYGVNQHSSRSHPYSLTFNRSPVNSARSFLFFVKNIDSSPNPWMTLYIRGQGEEARQGDQMTSVGSHSLGMGDGEPIRPSAPPSWEHLWKVNKEFGSRDSLSHAPWKLASLKLFN